MKRYYFNSISYVLTLYIVFLLLFYGARSLGGPAIVGGDTLDGIVVGYLLWSLAIMAYGDLSWDLSNQAQVGTLEQLYITPMGFTWINTCYLITNLIINLAISGVLLTLMMVSTGKYLNLNLSSALPIFLLTLLPAYGIGFAMGGLALVFKRIQAVFQIFQFVFVAFITLPWGTFPWARYLPLSMGNHLLQEIMIKDLRIWQLARSDLTVLIGTGVIYLGLGLIAFRWAEQVAKNKGLLGQY